jgi:hypothetical protein
MCIHAKLSPPSFSEMENPIYSLISSYWEPRIFEKRIQPQLKKPFGVIAPQISSAFLAVPTCNPHPPPLSSDVYCALKKNLTLTSSQAKTTSSGGSPSSLIWRRQELKFAASGCIYLASSIILNSRTSVHCNPFRVN